MNKTKQLIGVGAAVMTTLLALVVLWQFRTAVIYVLISLTLAAALRPLINHLIGKSIFVRVALIVLYVAVSAGIGFLLFRTGETALDELRQLAQAVSEQDEWTLPVWLEDTLFQSALVARLPPPSKFFEAIAGNEGQLVLPVLLGFTRGVSGAMSGLLVILFLSVYWSIGKAHFERLWLSLLPSGQRKQAREIWRTVEPDIGTYVRNQIVESLLAGLLFGLGYRLLGSPYPALLALAGALACLIPVVGAALAIIPPLLVGLLTSVQLALFTVLYTLIIFIALEAWVKPRLFSRRWQSPILTIALLLALVDAFGFVGIVVAPLVSVVCQILWSHLVSHRRALGPAAQVSDLIERQERVRANIGAMEEPPPPLVTSSMERLARLIAQAEPILQTETPAEASEPSVNIGPQSEQEQRTGKTPSS